MKGRVRKLKKIFVGIMKWLLQNTIGFISDKRVMLAKLTLLFGVHGNSGSLSTIELELCI